MTVGQLALLVVGPVSAALSSVQQGPGASSQFSGSFGILIDKSAGLWQASKPLLP